MNTFALIVLAWILYLAQKNQLVPFLRLATR